MTPVRTALVTGADQGIGHALAMALAARGDRVWAGCLEPAPELTAAGVAVVPGVDVCSDAAVARLAEAVADTRLGLVISNAGINASSGGPWDADTDAMARELQVNVLGAVRVVRTLLPSIAKGGKIGFVTTGRGAAMRDPAPANGMNYGYRISKGALNVFGALLAQDLAPHGIAVVLLHPGAVNTGLMRRMAAAGKSSLDPSALPLPEEVAPQLLTVLDGVGLDRSGRWLNLQGEDTDARGDPA
jgi:NAD(P)-dependent dehydrogenase (short-subunit alcohol dehydrogenase family)